MTKRHLAEAVALASLLVAILVLLFGDNLIERLFFSSAGEQAKTAETSAKHPAEEDVAEPMARENDANAANAGELMIPPVGTFGRLCDTQSILVNFRSAKSDSLRFKRRAGPTVIPISDCNTLEKTFSTRVENSPANQASGSFGVDSIDFNFRYWDTEGPVECRVVATEIKSLKFTGKISCEAHGDAIGPRPVDITVG